MNKFGKIIFILPYIWLVFLINCKVLMWKDTTRWLGGRWLNDSTYIEVKLNYKSKMHWYPLNQNELTKDIKSILLLHKIQNTIESNPLIEYSGWTLNDSMYLNEDKIILIRGTDDSIGSFYRDVMFFKGETAPKIISNLKIENLNSNILTAIPAPNWKKIAIFHSIIEEKNKNGKIYVDIIDLETLKQVNQISFDFPQAPATPLIAWSKDSSKIYIRRESDVLESSNFEKLIPSKSFPQCFIPTKNGNTHSPSGIQFLRDQDGKIFIEKGQKSTLFENVNMTDDIGKINLNCVY